MEKLQDLKLSHKTLISGVQLLDFCYMVDITGSKKQENSHFTRTNNVRTKQFFVTSYKKNDFPAFLGIIISAF